MHAYPYTMQWFNIARVKNPSKEEPKDKPIKELYHYVMDKADIPLYKMLNSDSLIKFYDMGNYLIARQYMIDRSTGTKTFYADYRLNLTDEAKKIVDALFKSPLKCHIKQWRNRAGTRYYEFITQYSVYIPYETYLLVKGGWAIEIRLDMYPRPSVDPHPIPKIGPYRGSTTIPFNCGPLRPLWKQAVECWTVKLGRTLRSKHVAEIRDLLLRYKLLDLDIVPLYPL